MNKYQEALDKIETQLLSAPNNDRNGYGKDFKFDESFEDEVHTLQQLIDKNERLVAHVKLAIKMLEENSPYAIETLKEVIEKDWSEDE